MSFRDVIANSSHHNNTEPSSPDTKNTESTNQSKHKHIEALSQLLQPKDTNFNTLKSSKIEINPSNTNALSYKIRNFFGYKSTITGIEHLLKQVEVLQASELKKFTQPQLQTLQTVLQAHQKAEATLLNRVSKFFSLPKTKQNEAAKVTHITTILKDIVMRSQPTTDDKHLDNTTNIELMDLASFKDPNCTDHEMHNTAHDPSTPQEWFIYLQRCSPQVMQQQINGLTKDAQVALGQYWFQQAQNASDQSQTKRTYQTLYNQYRWPVLPVLSSVMTEGRTALQEFNSQCDQIISTAPPMTHLCLDLKQAINQLKNQLKMLPPSEQEAVLREAQEACREKCTKIRADRTELDKILTEIYYDLSWKSANDFVNQFESACKTIRTQFDAEWWYTASRAQTDFEKARTILLFQLKNYDPSIKRESLKTAQKHVEQHIINDEKIYSKTSNVLEPFTENQEEPARINTLIAQFKLNCQQIIKNTTWLPSFKSDDVSTLITQLEKDLEGISDANANEARKQARSIVEETFAIKNSGDDVYTHAELTEVLNTIYTEPKGQPQ